MARSHEGAGRSFLSTQSPALALQRPLATPAAALGKHGSSDSPGHALRPQPKSVLPTPTERAAREAMLWPHHCAALPPS